MRAFFAVDSFAERVVDAVGSGDALLAYAALSMVATKNAVIASMLGSLRRPSSANTMATYRSVRRTFIDKIDRFERLVNYGLPLAR